MTRNPIPSSSTWIWLLISSEASVPDCRSRPSLASVPSPVRPTPVWLSVSAAFIGLIVRGEIRQSNIPGTACLEGRPAHSPIHLIARHLIQSGQLVGRVREGVPVLGNPTLTRGPRSTKNPRSVERSAANALDRDRADASKRLSTILFRTKQIELPREASGRGAFKLRQRGAFASLGPRHKMLEDASRIPPWTTRALPSGGPSRA